MIKLKNIAFVGNTGHFDNETNCPSLTVDGKWRKRTFLAGPAVVRRSPRQVCAGSASDKKHPRCVLIKWLGQVSVGLKIHAESS